MSLDSINDVIDHIPLQEVKLGRVFHNKATQRQTDFIHHNGVTRHYCLEVEGGEGRGNKERGREERKRGEREGGEEERREGGRRGSKERGREERKQGEREGVNSVCRNSHVSTTY